MLVAGSDDGVYRLHGVREPGDLDVWKVLNSGRVRRVRAFEGIDGVFAATETGLYHSPNGREWIDLDAPQTKVYAVGASPDGNRLYAGTRPANAYVAEWSGGEIDYGLAWRELDGFQDLPSRDEWRLPRHENLAQVRDVHVTSTAPDRVYVGVEVGGVHHSPDGGDTWTERRNGVHDDIHELRVIGSDELVAATGFGLFHSADAGQSWTRLDEGYDQRYFRAAVAIEDAIYAAGALANSSTWNDDDTDPELFVTRDRETVEPVTHPRPDEMVTGMEAVDGTLFAATHHGTLLVKDDEWTVTGSFPVPGDVTGRYTPLLWREA
ncbi:WD40/YVTN/BNR-like repeat-containing protein [Halorientalis marina]|jgi:photosystem II stability/assembly factor-like uncharacterized protein|uniref:WD40/YVTN/BNR-like repeat-containing protein n=1 Tax=Halorientalis marina TaxID=2931976 RepID=UPI001FF5FBD5|nr:WD40 repeat domain-containing protein [Halorientalis marina]